MAMTTSIILAKILGLYFIIISAVILVNGRRFISRIQGFTQDSGLLFFGTILSLIIGIILIVFHNIWVLDWRLLITLLGWLVFLRSVIYLFYPQVVEKLIKLFQSTRAIYISGIISLIIGIFLSYHGFR